MEKQNKETKKVIELVKKSDTFKLIIPEEVEKKIRYICQQIWKDEWSGTLFYKPEGRFEDGTLAIRCVDIYVMDIGTAAYTEFDMSPDVISYMTDNPELLDCQMGLIHSHNNMSTFFSGTDTTTLKEEGIDRNHFVSLIVNNEGTYTAAITRKVKATKTITENFSYPTFEDNEIADTKTYAVESEELEWFYLKIEFERSENSFQEVLKARLEEIKKAKTEKSNQLLSKQPAYTGGYGNWKGDKFQQGTLFPELDEKETQSYTKQIGSTNKIVNKSKDELSFDKDYISNKISDAVPYDYIEFNKETIKSLVLQLITGSIIIPNASKIDAKKWAQGMVPLYERRFGKGEEGIKLFKVWAEEYIDFLCWYTEDKNLTEMGFESEEIAATCAHDIIKELTKLPENVYIKEYIDILEGYLI